MQTEGRMPKRMIAFFFVCSLCIVIFTSRAWRGPERQPLAINLDLQQNANDSWHEQKQRSIVAIPILEPTEDFAHSIPTTDRNMEMRADIPVLQVNALEEPGDQNQFSTDLDPDPTGQIVIEEPSNQPEAKNEFAITDEEPTDEPAVEPAAETPEQPAVEQPAIEEATEEKVEEEPNPIRREDTHIIREPEDSAIVEQAKTVWPMPDSLIGQIQPLLEQPKYQPWAQSVLDQVRHLHSIPSLSSPESAETLQKLRQLAASVSGMVNNFTELTERAKILRAQYALIRRLDVWQHVYQTSVQPVSYYDATPRDFGAISQSLDGVERQLSRLQHHEAWREYLLLDKAAEVFFNESTELDERRKIAQRILLRLENPAFNETQHAFFTSPEFVQWRTDLLAWALEPIDTVALMQQLEDYEQRRKMSVAEAVSHNAQVLRWSTDEAQRKLGHYVDTHYRNANVRISISDKLMNRYLPKPQEFTDSVRDNIGGAAIRGTTKTKNQMVVKLIPDHYRIRLGLEAHGVIRSDTGAYSGPVVFWNRGQTRFQARKLILVDRRGLKVRVAEAWASSRNQVRGLQTDYDNVPIIGELVRNTAMDEHRSRSGQAKRQVEAKVEKEARTRLDTEVHKRLTKAEKNFQDKVLAPLQRMQLNPQAIGLQTTNDRIIVRARLAGHTQLASFTPRPQARSNSLMSIQVHQSALNNFVQQLNLDGGTFELRDLAKQLAGKLNLQDTSFVDEFPEDVSVRFAKENAIRFDFVDGRMAVTLRIVELRAGNRRWKAFAVRTFYMPTIEGKSATFSRDPESYIELVGKRLRLGDQVALRAIFTKVFSPKNTIPIMPARLINEPRLADVSINQFVIDDGWIGVSLAPTSKAIEQARRFGERFKVWR